MERVQKEAQPAWWRHSCTTFCGTPQYIGPVDHRLWWPAGARYSRPVMTQDKQEGLWRRTCMSILNETKASVLFYQIASAIKTRNIPISTERSRSWNQLPRWSLYVINPMSFGQSYIIHGHKPPYKYWNKLIRQPKMHLKLSCNIRIYIRTRKNWDMTYFELLQGEIT